MDVNSASLNRVFLPIIGFPQWFRGIRSEGWFRDVTSFEFIVETLVGHSAWEITLESCADEIETRLLENLPQALRKRIRFIDKDGTALKLAETVMSPVFNEFSIEPCGHGGISHDAGLDEKVSSAIAHTYWNLHTFLLGLRHKSEIDINISSFRNEVSVIWQESKTREARGNMSILQGILNCYRPLNVDALSVVPHATKKHLDLALSFLEDSMFKDLTKERYKMGLPLYVKKSLVKVKQIVRRIVSNERFEPLFNTSLKLIETATKVPLPKANLIQLILPYDYLPPILRLEPLLEEAKKVWKLRCGEEDIAERYERSTGESLL